MNSSYHAYTTALQKQYITPHKNLWQRYCIAKILTHRSLNTPTCPSVVPFIYRLMGLNRPLITQHTMMRVACIAQADNIAAEIVCGLTNYGELVDHLTLRNAVYLSLEHHAEYMDTPPIGGEYVMAIQIGERAVRINGYQPSCAAC